MERELVLRQLGTVEGVQLLAPDHFSTFELQAAISRETGGNTLPVAVVEQVAVAADQVGEIRTDLQTVHPLDQQARFIIVSHAGTLSLNQLSVG